MAAQVETFALAVRSRRASLQTGTTKSRLVSLLRFRSSPDEEKLDVAKEYVERMKEGQEEISYLSGESRCMVENSPHLEALKAKGYEE